MADDIQKQLAERRRQHRYRRESHDSPLNHSNHDHNHNNYGNDHNNNDLNGSSASQPMDLTRSDDSSDDYNSGNKNKKQKARKHETPEIVRAEQMRLKEQEQIDFDVALNLQRKFEREEAKRQRQQRHRQSPPRQPSQDYRNLINNNNNESTIPSLPIMDLTHSDSSSSDDYNSINRNNNNNNNKNKNKKRKPNKHKTPEMLKAEQTRIKEQEQIDHDIALNLQRQMEREEAEMHRVQQQAAPRIINQQYPNLTNNNHNHNNNNNVRNQSSFDDIFDNDPFDDPFFRSNRVSGMDSHRRAFESHRRIHNLMMNSHRDNSMSFQLILNGMPMNGSFLGGMGGGRDNLNISNMSYDRLMELFPVENRGANDEAIERLPTDTFKKNHKKKDENDQKNQEKEKDENNENNKCCICLEQFDDGDEIRRLPCMHIFHKDEIDKWLKCNRVCPICRIDIQDQQ